MSLLPLHAVGALVQEYAINTKPGMLLPVATSHGLNSTFQLATIEQLERVHAIGKLIPAIEHPFIVADGAVMPV
jgi:hypothetical protein